MHGVGSSNHGDTGMVCIQKLYSLCVILHMVEQRCLPVKFEALVPLLEDEEDVDEDYT